MIPIADEATLNAVRDAGCEQLLPSRHRIAVGMGTCGTGNGSESVYHAFADAIGKRGLDVQLVPTGCFGYCAEEPLVNVWSPGQPIIILKRVRPDQVNQILDGLARKSFPEALVLCKVEHWDHITAELNYGTGQPDVPAWTEIPFFTGQKKLVLRNCGLINPGDIQEYFGTGGYRTLFDVLREGSPDAVIERLKQARLRGRGGAGFSTGLKFEYLRKATGPQKYLICNADEGDPGAYMNRNELESDPHSLIEGMAIGGYATGATQGIIYVRAEYPLAVHRLQVALGQAREYGVLGRNILGRGFNFDIELAEGAGAFVCGEETALTSSLEGMSGRSRARPLIRLNAGCGESPPTSTTSKPGSISPRSSRKGRSGSPRSAARPAQAPKYSRWSERSKTPAWSRCPLVHRSANSSTMPEEAVFPAATSRPCRPAAPPVAASRTTCWIRQSTSRLSASSARSWAQVAWS